MSSFVLAISVSVSQEKQMMVYVERRVVDDASLSKDEAFGSIRNQLCTFREGNVKVLTFTCLEIMSQFYVPESTWKGNDT